MDVVGFDLSPLSWGHGLHHLTPAVNGVSLVDLVAGYEAERGDELAYGYDGIIWGLIKLGDLSAYLPGAESYPARGRLQVLSCTCGEWGCWPLYADITVADDVVRWDRFEQPHRSGRDYSGVGPFVFDRGQYQTAVRAAATTLAADDLGEGAL